MKTKITNINLMYHDVYLNDTQESGLDADSAFMYKMKVSLFEEHVASIRKALDEGIGHFQNVFFTFDDGGASFYTTIAPILEKYGFRGCFFIASKYINTPKFLRREQIKDLDKRGHIIASHSHTHPENIALLGYNDIVAEWKESCDILSAIVGHKVTTASIPNGDSSNSVERAAADAGIEILFTSEPTTKDRLSNGVLLKGRYVVYGDTKTAELLNIAFSETKRKKIKLRYAVLNILHKILGSNYNVIKTKILEFFSKKQ